MKKPKFYRNEIFFSAETFQFSKFHKNEAKHDKLIFKEVWPWHSRQKFVIYKKNWVKIWKLVFYGQVTSLFTIFLNTSKTTKFQKVLKSGKAYCTLEVVVAIFWASFHLPLGRELVKKNKDISKIMMLVFVEYQLNVPIILSFRAHLICVKSVMY